jgi:hypothetical protein
MSDQATSKAQHAQELERLRRRVRELETADEELARSHGEMEIRVEERVSELKAANAELGAEVADRKSREAELRKLNRALKARSRSAHALMHATKESDYLKEVCRIVVEDCGHAMVWIGFAEDDAAKTVRPMAYSGLEAGYIEKLRLTWADTERGRGPTGTAIRTGKPCSCANMLTDPNFAPWRAEAIKRGYASSLVLPLMARQAQGKPSARSRSTRQSLMRSPAMRPNCCPTLPTTWLSESPLCACARRTRAWRMSCEVWPSSPAKTPAR